MPILRSGLTNLVGTTTVGQNVFHMSAPACSTKYDLPAIIFRRDQDTPLQPRKSPRRALEAIVESILEHVVFGLCMEVHLDDHSSMENLPVYAWLVIGGGIRRMSLSRVLFVT